MNALKIILHAVADAVLAAMIEMLDFLTAHAVYYAHFD